jgi:spermidine/putrescine transport system substrate-binding protein
MIRLFALLASFLIAAPTLAKDQFHLYNWNNYIAPETIKRFEDFCK